MAHDLIGLLVPVSVPILGMGIAYLAIWTKHQRRLAEMHLMAAPQRPDGETQRRLDALEERLRVLERIATDGRHSGTLAAEIEALRDASPNHGAAFTPIRSALS